MPWWFWFAGVFGILSFVPLLIAGFKIKNWLWVGLGSVQLMWLWLSPGTNRFNIFMWFSIGLAIYVFTVVRRQYLTELEIEDAMRPQQIQQHTSTSTSTAPLKSWSCTGCGADNNNAAGVCEYCGVAMQEN